MLDDTLHNIPLGGPDPENPSENDSDLPETALFEDSDIENGRAQALFSYIGAAFFFPIAFLPLIKRDNPYSLYHGKQAAVIWMGILANLLLLRLTGAWILLFLLPFFWMAVLAGVSQINNDDSNPRPIPLIHSLADKLFKTIKLRPEPDTD